MSPTTQRTWTLRAAVIALALAVCTAGGLWVGLGTRDHDASLSDAGRLSQQPPSATRFRVSSFNLLGASHTAPGGDRKGWALGTKRMGWAVQLIEQNALDVIGFQEMQPPQFGVFSEQLGQQYRIFPGRSIDDRALANSIAWRRAEWQLVEKRTVAVPYFKGRMIPKPLVLLRQYSTGQLVWFFNTHNPANTHGQAQRWRDAAVRIQIQTVNDLRAETPDVPIVFTGDMNDRANFFCPFTAGAPMFAANGGVNAAGGICTPPTPTPIDWILGTPEVRFTGFTALDDALVNKTTDHPLFWADATLASPAAQAADVQRVVVIDAEGLPSSALARSSLTPRIHQMMAEGTSTLNARTTTERTIALPNQISILTGRPVSPTIGGHGVTGNTVTSTQILPTTAGRYVSSVFDLVHNFGDSTALFGSRPRLDLVTRSYDATNGGLDPYGADDGRAKIDTAVLGADDAATTASLVGRLGSDAPTLSVASFADLSRAGRASGYGTKGYLAAVQTFDARVGQVLDAIGSNPDLAGTMVVLVGDSGGTGTTSQGRTDPANYTVPLIVWGAPVAAGTDLYAINPAYTDPGTAQVSYAAGTPIRIAAVANLITGALGLPAIPGALANPLQDLNVFVSSEPPPAPAPSTPPATTASPTSPTS